LIVPAGCWILDAGYWMLDTGCWMENSSRLKAERLGGWEAGKLGGLDVGCSWMWDEIAKSRFHHVFGISCLVFGVKYSAPDHGVRSLNTKY